MAKLSVVVPFFNVEEFIGEALESIAKQTLRDLEVIMVDDGSTDGSSVIAKSFATRDSRFKLVQQQNQGLGPARNTGVRHATGRYLAFADSDDLLDLHAYELLVSSLEKTGSDIACGGVRRFKPMGLASSWLHDEAFRETALRTHVTRRPVLLRDRTAWNKVFRRSFWDAHDLEFPGTLYEDGPVVLRAHVLASSVDIFRDVVYYWRVRDSGELSITQRARDIANIEERMASVGTVGRFLAEAAPALKPRYDESVLNVDLAMLVRAYELASEPERRRLAELARTCLSTVDESVYREVTAAKRLEYYLLRKDMSRELVEVLRYWRRGDGFSTSVAASDTSAPRWYARYPFFRDPTRGIPDEVYDVTDEMRLIARLDSVTWRAGRLRIEGHAYIRRLSSASPGECKIQVVLRNNRAHRTIRLRPERIFRPDVTGRSAQAVACYDWSGFAVEVNPRRLALAPGVWRVANWELRVEVSGAGLRREGPIGGVAPGSAQWPAGRWIGSAWVQPAVEHDGRFFVRGRRVGAFVTDCRSAGDALELEGWTTSKLTTGATVLIAPRAGGTTPISVAAAATAVPVVGGRRGRHPRTGFVARVPIAQLATAGANASAIDQAIQVHDEVTWDLSLAPGGDGAAVRLTIAPETAGARARDGGREVTAFVTPFGYLSMLERTVRPVVTQLEWTDGERLILRGDHTNPHTRPTELLLRHGESTDTQVVPLTWEQGTFTAEFAPGRMPGLAGELPLARGNWNLLAACGDGKQVTVAVARGLLPSLPDFHAASTHQIAALPYRTDALRLRSRTSIGDDERGRYARRQLERHDYPQALARPLRDLAVFDSFSGRQCSCNPRAIYERLRAALPDLECAWVSRDGQFSVPDGGRTVFVDSRSHFEALAQARYVIFNDTLPAWFKKRDGQFCLQTWHGTPLKRIGLDIERPQFATGLIYPDVLRKDAADWDVLLSPNGFSTPIFRHALGFSGEIMESGYPRNDLLHKQGQEQRAAAIRERLGLPHGKRVVLYAPTWRDDALQLNGRYRFELQLDLDAAAKSLGGDHVLLLRLHANERNGGRPRGHGGFVFDVTHYPDITDLYLISDVLITDYSSVMFDFAGTGRPMLFFTYDLERYRDKLRGFYFDFEAEAPGPLVRTTDEVVEALRDVDQIAAAHQQAYKAFKAKFCALDDGAAAARVVDRLLAGQR